MKTSLILLALVALGIAANIDDSDSAIKGLDDIDQELEDFILEEDDEEEDDFDEDEDEEQSSSVRSLPFIEGRSGVCAGKAKGGCTKKGGVCVTEPFADNCKAIHGDVGKLKKQGCLSKDCQCCVPPPTCSGKIKKSCSKNGGYCVLKPFKSNCRGGTLNKKACKSKFCQCCTPGATGGNKETTPAKPATTAAAPEKTTLPPKTTAPPPPPTTLPPPPPTTAPPPPPTTTPAPPPTTPKPTTPKPTTPKPTTPKPTTPKPTTPKPTTPKPTTTKPTTPKPTTPKPTTPKPITPKPTTPKPTTPKPTTAKPTTPKPTTPKPETTTPPPPPTTLPPVPTTQAVPVNSLLPNIKIRDELVQWKQGHFFGIGGNKQQDYSLVLARGPGLEREFVYIQHSYPHDGLINVCDLQYGTYESNGQKGVFFVYHDKSQTPYQKRFGLKANGIDQEILLAIGMDINSGAFPGTSSSNSFWSFSWVWGDDLKDVDC